MTIDLGANANATITAPGDLIKDASTATFQADVLDASQATPVLVDFWAPWCGPCKQLGPALEKVVTELGGKVKLVKINVDENQQLAGQMGVQSIPAVFAFAGGRPVDGFMGAQPEGEIRRFIQKVLDQAPAGEGDMNAEIKSALEAADQALADEDFARAEQIYGLVLQHMPDNDDALLGLGMVYLKQNDLDRVNAVIAEISEDGQKKDAYAAIQAGLQLAGEAASLGSTAEFEERLNADPNDHQARFDLALVLNANGQKIEAAEQLVTIMRKNRDWNEDAARLKLIELLESWGPKDPATARGRRLLSSALFV